MNSCYLCFASKRGGHNQSISHLSPKTPRGVSFYTEAAGLQIKHILHTQLQLRIRRSTYICRSMTCWLLSSLHALLHTYTQRSGDFIACCSCCFLCISRIAFLVRDICEGAPTNPDSLCLQLEHVVAHLWRGSAKLGMGWGEAWQNRILHKLSSNRAVALLKHLFMFELMMFLRFCSHLAGKTRWDVVSGISWWPAILAVGWEFNHFAMGQTKDSS